MAAPQPCDFCIGGGVARHQRRVHTVKQFDEVGSGVGRGIRNRPVHISCTQELTINLSVPTGKADTVHKLRQASQASSKESEVPTLTGKHDAWHCFKPSWSSCHWTRKQIAAAGWVILHTRFSDDLGGWRTLQELLRPGLFHLPIFVALRVMLPEGAFDCSGEIEADGWSQFSFDLHVSKQISTLECLDQSNKANVNCTYINLRQ